MNNKIGVTILLVILLMLIFVLTGKVEVAAAKFNLTCASQNPETYPTTQGAIEFARLIKERTNGEVEIKIFHSGALGNERDITESCINGTIDLGTPAINRIAFWENDWEVWSLPYLVTSFEAGKKITSGSIFKKMNEDLIKKQNLRVLAPFASGFRCIANNKRPIETRDDLKDIKMRVSPTPLFVRTYSLMGAQATPMPFSEVFSALKQGVIDGYENDPASHYSNKFYEVTKYLSITNTVFYNGVLIMSEKTFQKLPPEFQKIFLDTADEVRDYVANLFIDLTDSAIEKLEELGTVVNYPDLEQFKKAVEPLYDEFREKLSPGLVDEVIKEARGL